MDIHRQFLQAHLFLRSTLIHSDANWSVLRKRLCPAADQTANAGHVYAASFVPRKKLRGEK